MPTSDDYKILADLQSTGTDQPPKNRSNPRVRVLESEKREIWHAGNTHLGRSAASYAILKWRLPRGRWCPCNPRHRGNGSNLLSLA